MMKPEGINESAMTKILEGRALTFRTHDRAAPKDRIKNVGIRGRNVEVATNKDSVSNCRVVLQTGTQPLVPAQLVMVGGRSDSLAVRCVNAVDAQAIASGLRLG